MSSGLSGTLGLRPAGRATERNIMNLMWRRFVDERDDIRRGCGDSDESEGLAGSGHVDTFVDPYARGYS